MRNSLRATKFALWVIFAASTVALVLFFGLNSILAGPGEEATPPEEPGGETPWVEIRRQDGRLVATAVNLQRDRLAVCRPQPAGELQQHAF